MTVVHWNRAREMDQALRRSRVPRAARRVAGEAMAGADFVPAVDIRETEGAFEIDVELPGVEPADVTVDLREGVLSVRGERRRAKREQAARAHRGERRFGRFARTFLLPESADADAIRARATNGVLSIEVGKKAETQPRSIEVEVH
jgi:HSP20 family protein